MQASITIEGLTFNIFQKYTPKLLVSIAYPNEFPDNRNGGYRNLFKKFTADYSKPPRYFVAQLNVACFEARKQWEPHLSKLIRSRNSFMIGLLYKLEDVLPILDQLLLDNLYHLAPIVFLTEKDPHELSEMLPKRVWKKITSNSFYRNHAIVREMLKYPGEDLISWFVLTENVPVTFIKRYHAPPLWLHYAWKFDPRTAALCVDTIRMASQLGLTYNPEWSERRWREEHDKMATLINAGEYSDKEFAPERVVDTRSLRFSLLNSPKRMHEEGVRMGHCVASYMNRTNYRCYKVTGEIRATLGVFNGTFDQMFGKFNSGVPEQFIQTARELIQRGEL